MTHIRIELTVEPFVEGRPGPHVLAAVEALRGAGLQPEVGPFATAAEGEAGVVLTALRAAAGAAFAGDATSISVTMERVVMPGAESAFLDAVRPVLRKLGAMVVPATRMRSDDEPLWWQGRLVGAVRRSGLPPDPSGAADPSGNAGSPVIPGVTEGSGAGSTSAPAGWPDGCNGRDLLDGPDVPIPSDRFDVPDLVAAVPRFIARVERELGGPLGSLSRAGKQQAALRLEQLGAFQLRNSVDAVADAMGVSRVTVYNYLSAVRSRREVADE